jgi:hypothetical protein
MVKGKILPLEVILISEILKLILFELLKNVNAKAQISSD